MRSQNDRKFDSFIAMRLIADGRTRKDIAKRIGISETQLARDLARFGFDSYVRTEHTFREKLFKKNRPELYDKVMGFDLRDNLENKLIREFGNNAPVVRVMSLNRGSFEARLDEFARPAAVYVGKLLSRSRFAGLAWGGTIASVAKYAVPHPKQKRPIQFLPLCGDAPRSENFALCSSSTLALRFHETFNADFPRQPEILSLGTIPMMLPSGLKPTELKLVKRVFEEQSMAYEKIFGPRLADNSKCLINKVDTIISGVGSHKHPCGHIDDSFLTSHTSLSREELGTRVHGDIAGNLLPRAGISSEAKNDIDRLNDAILGVRIEDIQNCAQRARRTGSPGVVVLAISRRKAKPILRLIEIGAINTLICDSSLKKALISMSNKSRRDSAFC